MTAVEGSDLSGRMTLRLLALLLVTCSLGSHSTTGQVHLSRYLSQEYTPAVDLFAYRDIYVRWNMEGTIQAYLNEGINSLHDDEINAAVANLTKALELDRKLVAAHYYLGICYKLQLKLLPAEKSLLRALELNDTLAAGHLELGEIYEAARLYDRALSAYEKSTQTSAKFADGYFHQGNLKFVQQKFSEAEGLYYRTVAVDPTFDDAYVMLGRIALATKKKPEDAMPFFQRAVKADSLSKDGLLWRGITYADLGAIERSLADWDKLVRYFPNQPFFLYMRGFLQIEVGDLDKAFADFRRAITANLENADKFEGGQTILDKRIDLQSAARLLIKKLYGFKEPDLTNLKSGFCFLLAMRYQGAIKWFTKVNSKDGIVFFFRGLTYEHAGVHDLALEEYSKAIAADPDIFDAYKKRAIYRMELGDFQAATNDVAEMIRIDSSSTISYKIRGIAKALSGDCTNAVNDLTRFIASDSTDMESFKTRGFCHEQNKRWASAGSDFMMAYAMSRHDVAFLTHAVSNFELALKENPDDHQTRYYLGRTLYDAGDRDGGLKLIQQASRKGNSEARALLKQLRN